MEFNEQWQEFIGWHREYRERSGRDWFRCLWQYEVNKNWYFLLEELSIYGGAAMVRGKGQMKLKPVGNGNTWTQFVDISLTGHSWEDVVGVYGSSEVIDEGLSELIASGYRVGFAYNAQNDAVLCSVTCKDEASPNSGKTFNAFAGRWVDALSVALYKHYVIAREDWTATGEGSNRPLFG